MNTATISQLPGGSGPDLFEDAPVAFHELDPEGVIRRVNAAECAMLGFDRADMIGKPIWDFIAGEEILAGRSALAGKLSGQQPLVPFLRQYVRRDGQYITVEIRDRLILDNAGRAVGIRSAIIDVTERTKAEKALHESERWVKTILRSLCEGVVATDALGLIKSLNPSAESVTGWPEEEASGRDIDEVVRFHADGAEEAGDRVVLGSRLSEMTIHPWQSFGWILSRSGDKAHVCLTSAPILDESGRAVGVTLTLRRRLSSVCERVCYSILGLPAQ